MNYIVICRVDRDQDDEPGRYVLATRRVFPEPTLATEYANTVAPSREPIVVEGDFRHLRFNDFRQINNPKGTL